MIQPENIMQEYINNSIQLPDDWVRGDEIDSRNFHDEYPHLNSQSGSVLMMEWGHQTREESIGLYLSLIEGEPFGITVDTKDGMLHGHSTDTLDTAIVCCSTAAYMMNHLDVYRTHDHEKERLEKELEGAQEAAEALQKRCNVLERKNEMLRNQMNTLIHTQTCGYDEGNWHGLIEQPQSWRPPFREEILRFADHIDYYWFDNEPYADNNVSQEAVEVVADSYFIVLEDYRSVVTNVEDKTMFVFHKSDGMYNQYLFRDDDQSLKEVEQRTEMVSHDPQGDIVVSFGNGI